jgi:uncharacterized protein YggL (DUF469 family)
MKKRLRKKKHYGEFTEYGFEITITRNRQKDFDEFFDSFILEAIEGNNCSCGGGGVEDKLEFVVECGTRENLNSKLKLITEWLDGRPDVIKYKTRDFFALWH